MRRSIVVGLALSVCAGFWAGRLSVAPSAGAASLRAPLSVPAGFVGTWQMHGGSLTINGNGLGVNHFRTYVFCTQTRLTACDRVIKSTIYAGGYDNFQITRAQGKSAQAGITDSAYSWEVGTSLKITLGKQDTITMHLPSGNVLFCGPSTPVGTCGA
jgi:hypothetical protein